jgi:hypothetical protein
MIYHSSTVTCIPNTLIGGTLSGTTIYGSTAVCSPVAIFSGCVGIGTISPAALLHVSQPGGNTQLRIGNNSTYDQFIYFNGNSDWSIGMDYSNSNAFVISNNSSLGTNDRVVLTTSGNLGLGFTPSASGTNTRALQLTNYGTVSGNGNIGSISLAANAYESADNCWNRVNATSAGLYQISYTGQHTWSYTGASTANSAITWTQAMLLNNSGNLGLGVTPSTWSLGKAIEIGNIGNAIWSVNATQYNILHNDYYNGGYVYASSNPESYYQQASGNHTW